MPPEKWTTLKSETVFDHQWYQLRRDHVRLPNGHEVDDFFVSIRSDIVMALPITADNEVVMVRQYRHGVGQILLELPAGALDHDESPLSAVKRELREETGYEAPTWQPLGRFYNSPVKQTNQIHLFKATAAQYTQPPQLDTTEDIEVVCVPVEAIASLIASRDICVAGSIVAFALGLPHLFAAADSP